MKRLAAIALAVAAFAARAATTNEVDVAALVAAVDAGLSETNGWTLSGLGKYADDSSLFFNAQGDSLLSKVYDAPIIGVVVSNRCSTLEPARVMCVFADTTERELGRFTAVGSKQERRTLMFADAGVKRIRFQTTTGGSGNWGIGAIWVITADPVYMPSNFQVSHNGGDWCGLSWMNGGGTVSNRVETFSVERGIGETQLFETGFDDFYGNTTSARDFSDKISEILGAEMSGVRVYGARGTNGICQTGTADGLGILRHSGFADYRGIKLRMSARYLSGCQPQTMVAYEFKDTTNIVETVTLTDEFEDYEIDLSSVTNGAAILLGYWTPTKSNRSVQIDSLSFVRIGADVSTSVDSRWIPATQGATSFSTRDHEIELLPKSEYRFEVRAQNADGLISDPAAVDVVLDSPPGFRFILR